ncbi:HlyD family secretion protein [Salmonella enterica subsp. enterica]|nr:HlyD family secretion protein [Salmonella enterica subsp. enterica]
MFNKKKQVITWGIGALAIGAVILSWWIVRGRYIQSTDDAYVGGNITSVASKVPGYISRIMVKDNQKVNKGDIIIYLDDKEYRAVVSQAQAKLEQSQARLENIHASVLMQHSIIQSAANNWQAIKLESQKIQQDSRRYDQLSKSSAISQQIRDNTRLDYQRMLARERKADSDYQTEKLKLAVLEAQEKTARASVKEALSVLTRSKLDLEYTVVRAPINGIVTNRKARNGSWVAGGSQLVSLVPANGLWIDANFKENQISGIKPGMRAEIHADILKSQVFYGYVESLAPATGASFSLIPVENATGNFTKIVQRVPVRIALDSSNSLLNLLRPGLSVSVSIDEKS